MAENTTLTGNSFDMATLTKAEIDAEVKRLTDGCDYSKINLKTFRGGKLFAVLFTADGKPAYEEDPDDGSRLMVKLIGDSGWQFVDAIHAKLKAVKDADKFMAWLWNPDTKEYEFARTRYNDKGVQIGAEGIIDHYIRRKAGKSTATSLPGVAELGFLSTKAAEIAKAAKKEKGKFQKDDGSTLVKYFVFAVKAMGLTKQDVLRHLKEGWPELFEKEPAAPKDTSK